MEIFDARGYVIAKQVLPVFILCTVIGYLSLVLIIPNLFFSFARRDKIFARLMLVLFIGVAFPIYVKSTYWVQELTLMHLHEIHLYEIKHNDTSSY